MSEKKNGTVRNIVYAEHEEQVSAGLEKRNEKETFIFQLTDLISCLNFCDYELDKIRKKISEKIRQLDDTGK